MTTFEGPDEEKSIEACYEILPFEEAMDIWGKCPLPPISYAKKPSNDDDDEQEMYLA